MDEGGNELVWLAVLVIIAAAILRPERASCPPGMFVEGVRPSGATQCLPSYDPSPSCAGAVVCPDAPMPRGVPLQIYCTGGSVPIVVDYRTVGCTRRFGS